MHSEGFAVRTAVQLRRRLNVFTMLRDQPCASRAIRDLREELYSHWVVALTTFSWLCLQAGRGLPTESFFVLKRKAA